MASDGEEETPQQEVEEVINDLPGAIRRVLKDALTVDGVIRGLHEVAKHLEAGKARVCFLASSCNEEAYKKLVKGLCLEHNVQVVEVEDNKQLGEWAGLCKIDAEGNPKKVVGATCVVITEYGKEEGPAYEFLTSYLSSNAS